MPAKPEGVYRRLSATGLVLQGHLGPRPADRAHAMQITRRGFRTATEAGRARRGRASTRSRRRVASSQSLDRPHGRPAAGPLPRRARRGRAALGGQDALRLPTLRARLRPPVARRQAGSAISPLRPFLTWQRQLTKGGGVKKGKPFAPNTIRLARAHRSLGRSSWRCDLASWPCHPALPVPRPRVP